MDTRPGLLVIVVKRDPRCGDLSVDLSGEVTRLDALGLPRRLVLAKIEIELSWPQTAPRLCTGHSQLQSGWLFMRLAGGSQSG